MARELGVFCGTFNPIHWGHLIMAEMARDQFQMEHVMMITSPSPPHRHSELLDAESRFEMVSAACQDNPKLFASRLELERKGPSFTVDTLKQIDTDLKHIGVHINLIIGEDNLPFISQWHNANEIFRLCRLIIAPRDKQPHHTDYVSPSQLPSGVDAAWLTLPHIGVSSTNIRQRVKEGRSVLYLVPPRVDAIIQKKGYYK
jgi:nicotinate-nucleotide adenylyltransferase